MPHRLGPHRPTSNRWSTHSARPPPLHHSPPLPQRPPDQRCQRSPQPRLPPHSWASSPAASAPASHPLQPSVYPAVLVRVAPQPGHQHHHPHQHDATQQPHPDLGSSPLTPRRLPRLLPRWPLMHSHDSTPRRRTALGPRQARRPSPDPSLGHRNSSCPVTPPHRWAQHTAISCTPCI